ncbi:MAG TPA: XRE family transcriptional regulator [Flavobacterium sp.]|nr:XRE family transcriptional regulator [Flavobacterium sp.]
MVNLDDFIKRLEIILEYYALSASAFADKINVQRSSMSHLLSGRNKPSLDFILKITEEFSEVSLDWIINGKGTFPKSDFQPAPTPLQEKPKNISSINNDLFSTLTESPKQLEQSTKEINTLLTTTDDEIERIVIFFKNGRFKNYVG